MFKKLFLAALMLFSTSVFATDLIDTTKDNVVSGMWWVPAESGWGVSFDQQRNVVFAAIFTYEEGAAVPTWYTTTCAPLTHDICTGDLYTFTGGYGIFESWDPYFGKPPTEPKATYNSIVELTNDLAVLHYGTVVTVDKVSVWTGFGPALQYTTAKDGHTVTRPVREDLVGHKIGTLSLTFTSLTTVKMNYTIDFNSRTKNLSKMKFY